jgi:hypothetical protein
VFANAVQERVRKSTDKPATNRSGHHETRSGIFDDAVAASLDFSEKCRPEARTIGFMYCAASLSSRSANG